MRTSPFVLNLDFRIFSLGNCIPSDRSHPYIKYRWRLHLFLWSSKSSRKRLWQRWWLHSTTGSYGWSVIEVTYERLWFTPPRLFERYELRKSGWDVDMIHHSCLTHPGQHQCGLSTYIFFGFQGYKNLYVLCFSNLYVC